MLIAIIIIVAFSILATVIPIAIRNYKDKAAYKKRLNEIKDTLHRYSKREHT